MAIAGLGNALGIIGQGIQQKAQADWQEQRQANLERIRAEERGQDKSERDTERKLRSEERLIDIAARDKDREADNKYRADSLAANERSDKARIGIAQAGLDEQRKDSNFQKEAALMAQALKPHNDIMSAIQSVSASQPTYTADGSIKGYASEADFNAAKGRQLEALTKQMNQMKPKIQESVREAYSRISPENRKWFDGLEKQLEAPAETPEQKAEAERRAFLTSPEEVAKRKAAQAAADAGTPQPQAGGSLLNRAASVPAAQDPRWIARQEEIKRLGEANAAKAAEEKRLQDEENYRILEARRLGRGSDMPAKPVFSSNGFDRRY